MDTSVVAYLDWGTTNFRAYFINQDGSVLWHYEAPKGISSLTKDEMVALLENVVDESPFDNPTFYACGMVGSGIGWLDVPHQMCPAGLDTLVENLCWTQIGRFKVGIVPGLKTKLGNNWDVMRGEEIQVFGCMLSQDSTYKHGEQLIITPGTHSKWVHVNEGQICSFFTAMTGELYNLVAKNSLLKHHLGANVTPSADFEHGVNIAKTRTGLARHLFTVRGNALFNDLTLQQASDFVSGLFIGAEIIDGLEHYHKVKSNSPIALIGNPSLINLYSHAFSMLGHDAAPFDAQDINRTTFIKIHNTIESSNGN